MSWKKYTNTTNPPEPDTRQVIEQPDDVIQLLTSLADRKHEVFVVLLLNAMRRLMVVKEMWQGSLAEVRSDPEAIVELVQEHAATAFITAHNHPSGNAFPSGQDINAAITLAALAKSRSKPGRLAIFLDEIIVTRSKTFVDGYSFAYDATFFEGPEPSDGMVTLTAELVLRSIASTVLPGRVNRVDGKYRLFDHDYRSDE